MGNCKRGIGRELVVVNIHNLKIEESETDLVNSHIYLPKRTMNIEEFTFPRSWQQAQVVTVGSLPFPWKR